MRLELGENVVMKHSGNETLQVSKGDVGTIISSDSYDEFEEYTVQFPRRILIVAGEEIDPWGKFIEEEL